MVRTHRKSGIELLRILCMLGIIAMHEFGNFMQNASGYEIAYGVALCSLFNCGVSVFALISGYFKVNGNARKVIDFELQILFWSLLSYIIKSAIYGSFSASMLLEAITPVFSRKYWYMTEYMVIMLFSRQINDFCQRLTKEQFLKMLMVFFVIACVIPTVIQRDLTGYDGKSFLNLLFMYLIGQYLNRFFNIEHTQTKKLILVFVSITALTFILNMVGTSVYNVFGNTGVHNPFGKDNSVFIVILATTLFLLFYKFEFSSVIINTVAKCVLPAYLFENAAGLFIKTYVYNLDVLRDSKMFLPALTIYPVIVFAFCAIVASLKNGLLSGIERRLTNRIEKITVCIFDWGYKTLACKFLE